VPARPRDELQLCGPVDLERRKVAGVDADHLGLERDGPVQLVGVVRLDERIEPELARVRQQFCGSLVVEVAEEEQRCVGTGELHLQEL